MKVKILYCTVIGIVVITSSVRGQFSNNDLAILVAAASANNTTVSVVEINKTTSGQSAIQTISIPGAGTDAIRVSGSATSTLYAANSNDGTFFCFTGANNTNTSSNVNTLNPRAVVTIDNAGTISLAATYNGTSGNQTRCATTVNNTDWYIGDQGGFYTNGSSSASPSGNIRSVKSFGGVVYGFTASASLPPVGTISAASGGTFTSLPGLANGATSRQDFFLISSGSNDSTFDVLYVLDASSASAGTIYKYSLLGGSWSSNGSYTTTFGGFGLAAEKSGGGAALYVTTGTGATVTNSVIRLTDDAGYNATISITTGNNVNLYTTASGTIIKGIAFAPPIPTYSLVVTSSHGTITKVPDQQNYQYGTSVQLTATPDTTYHFVTWGGDVPLGHETDNPLTMTMNQNRTITAFFALNTFSPTLILPTDSNITSTTAILGAKVVSNGNDSITERGVVWSTSSDPTITDHKVIASDTNEVYTVTVNSLLSGTLIYFKGYAINKIGTGYSPQATFYTLSREPATIAGSFSAKAILAHQIDLSWDTATGASGYVILQRTNADPTAVPKDANSYAVGDSIGDGLVVGLISLSAKTTMSITGLTALTTYHFSIIPFAWDGLHVSTYNYKTDTVPTANAKTVKQAEFISVLLPQYIQGNFKPNSDRIPFAYRGRLTGLLANATYRFVNQVVLSTEPDSADGAGNCIFISMTGDFVLTSAPSIESPGSYGTLKTDSSGMYEGWFITEPTGNYRFVPGKYIFMRIQLNDGISGTIAATHLTMMDSVRIVKLNPSISDSTGTGLRCTSAANPKDFVFVYDNKAGTGRPISGSFIENDGTANTIENNYAAFYANHVDGIDGSFGVVVPNMLPNGVRRVERRSLTTGAVVVFATDDNGIWPSGVNTVNPSGGTTELILAGTDVRWTTGVQNTNMIPDKFALFQNYPNPFNPETQIPFDLPGNGFVTLKIYDILGRQISTLVNKTMQAGHHSYVWNSYDLPSGIYFYKINYQSFTQVRKMVLMK